MSKNECNYTDYLHETLEMMQREGLLLVSVNKQGQPNVMTIGWGTIGIIWEKPIFVVLVRPSRYTYGFIEQSVDFTVNVPPKELADAVAFCGSVSGRDRDKFKEKGLIIVPGRKVTSPIIEQCVVHYECRVVHKNDVIKEELLPEINSSCYPKGDYHRIYFGEILSVYADEDVREKI